MSYTLFENPTRKARKQHKCIWCAEWIEEGTTYIDERSVYDGNIQRHRWHPECQVALGGGEDQEFSAWDNDRPGSDAGTDQGPANAPF